METLIVSIIVYAFIFFIGIAIGITYANKIESSEFKSAKSNAFDMIYYDSMSRRYADKAADKAAVFRNKQTQAKAAYEADAVKLSERERNKLNDYISDLEYKSDDLTELYDKD